MKTQFLSIQRKAQGRFPGTPRFPLHACALLDESFILADFPPRLNVPSQHR